MSEAGKAEKPKKEGKRQAVNTGTNVAIGEHAKESGYVPRFKKRYNETIKAELMKKFGYKTEMQVPRIRKITLNMGVGEGRENAKTFLRQNPDMANAIEATIRGNAGIVAAALSNGAEKDDAADD